VRTVSSLTERQQQLGKVPHSPKAARAPRPPGWIPRSPPGRVALGESGGKILRFPPVLPPSESQFFDCIQYWERYHVSEGASPLSIKKSVSFFPAVSDTQNTPAAIHHSHLPHTARWTTPRPDPPCNAPVRSGSL